MDLRLDTGYRQIRWMALPISLAMIVPQINSYNQQYLSEWVGEMELASAGITGVYYLIFAVIGSRLNNGLQSLIARRASVKTFPADWFTVLSWDLGSVGFLLPPGILITLPAGTVIPSRYHSLPQVGRYGY